MPQTAHSLLRLVFPQWQGGYDESPFPGQIYPLGARLLAWLAPESTAPLVEIPVAPPQADSPAPRDGGVFYRQEILRQLRAAQEIIRQHAPRRIVTFGGDCLISQAPFSYLNELYAGDLAIIWIDAHPDITTPRDFDHAHAMVLGNLLGEGEALLAAEVARPVRPEQVALVGVDGVLPHEDATIRKWQLHVIPSRDIIRNSTPLLDWLRQSGFRHAAIHLDIGVLDPAISRPCSSPIPMWKRPSLPGTASCGQGICTVFWRTLGHRPMWWGMSFTKYMPWDALALKKLLSCLNRMPQ